MALLTNVFTSMQCPIPTRCSRTRRMPIAACILDHRVDFTRKSFPDDFKFGTASAAFQIEGAVNEGGRGKSIWDPFTHEPGKIENGDNADIANDSYHLYMEDIKLMKAMGFNSYRFSISWPRILPDGTKGSLNREGITHYNNLIDALKENGIEPFVTIFHWDLPLELETKYRGFLNSDIVNYFKDFADVCFQHFGDRVKHWITMNEPNIFTLGAYDQGFFPPGRCTPENCKIGDSAVEPYTVGHNLLRCHAETVKLYRTSYQANQKGQIGITLATTWFKPFSSSNADQQAAERAIDFMFGWYLEPVVFGDYPFNMKAIVRDRLPTFTDEESKLLEGSYDFIGLNYYYSNYAQSLSLNYKDKPVSYSKDSHTKQTGTRNGIPIGIKQKSLPKKEEKKQEKEDKQEELDVEDQKQYVYPRGIKELVLYVKSRYRNPTIYITENGFGTDHPPPGNPKVTEEDSTREEFFADHLWELQNAIRMGANVKGLFAWTLVDCFEWVSGYSHRMGLCGIDRKTMKRLPKQSSEWFTKFLSNNGK